MSKSYHRTVCFLSVILALSACQSDEAKIKHLRADQAIAELNRDYWRDFVGSYSDNLLPKYAIDSLSAAQARLDLANRDLNKFMH